MNATNGVNWKLKALRKRGYVHATCLSRDMNNMAAFKTAIWNLYATEPSWRLRSEFFSYVPERSRTKRVKKQLYIYLYILLCIVIIPIIIIIIIITQG